MLIAVPWRPLLAALTVTLLGAAGVLATNVVSAGPVLGGMLGFGVGAILIAAFWRRSHFGAANSITLARVVGTSWVLTLVISEAAGTLPPLALALMIAVGSACLVLDGVDGYVARRRGEVSDFGARFDMETDAALLLVLSAAVALLEVAGWWVLAIGGQRYAYVAASWVLPALRTPLDYRYSRKVVAVVQGVALLLALALSLLPVPPAMPRGLLVAALVALMLSFARDAGWQLRTAAAAATAAATTGATSR